MKTVTQKWHPLLQLQRCSSPGLQWSHCIRPAWLQMCVNNLSKANFFRSNSSLFSLGHYPSRREAGKVDTHCSPGAGSPLVSSKHMGAARAVTPGTEVLVLKWVSKASAWVPLRAWWHGTVLVSLWDIIWVTLTPINHVVAVVDTHHLSGCLTLPTSHGTLCWIFRKKKGYHLWVWVTFLNTYFFRWQDIFPGAQLKVLESSLTAFSYSHLISLLPRNAVNVAFKIHPDPSHICFYPHFSCPRKA